MVFAPWYVVMVFALWEFLDFDAGSRHRSLAFFITGFCFGSAAGLSPRTSEARFLLCLLLGLDLPPFVRWISPVRLSVSQAKQIRFAKLGVSGAPALGDLNKAERLDFPNSGRNRVTVDAESEKVVEGHGQSAVVGATMGRKLDLDAIQYATAGEAQHGHCGLLQHFDQGRGANCPPMLVRRRLPPRVD